MQHRKGIITGVTFEITANEESPEDGLKVISSNKSSMITKGSTATGTEQSLNNSRENAGNSLKSG